MLDRIGGLVRLSDGNDWEMVGWLDGKDLEMGSQADGLWRRCGVL